MENGVEARLLKAIQETPVHHYNVEDLCPQCQAESRQSTLKYSRTRPGYETIGWKDRDYFQKRVPSMDSINRKSITYQRSNNGSSSDVSHLYEYISDYPYVPSYNSTGRTSSHSPKLYSRTNSLKRSNSRNISEYNPATESENIQYQYSKNDLRNGKHPSRMSITSIHSRYEDRSTCPRYCTDRSPYQASGSESSNYQTRVCDKGVYKGYNSDIPPDLIRETHRNLDSTADKFSQDCLDKNKIQPTKASATGGEPTDSSKSIKGYQYKFNPSYYDGNTKSSKTTTNRKPQQLHMDDSPTESGIGKSRHKRKGKSRRQSSDSYNSNCSESTSLSGSYNANVFQRDKT